MKRVFIFLFIFQLIFASDAEDALKALKNQSKIWDKGESFGKSILDKIKSNINKLINNPITKGQDLYTLDGKKKVGKVSITCGEDKTIMKISYSTTIGENINLLINGDLNLDDKFEYSTNIDGISGICANGFIRCDDGTWDNCKYYLLEFNGGISYTETVLPKLSGCYCINSSCGGLSSKSKSRVLNDIAGTIASIIKDKNYIVSEPEVNNNYAYIRGKSINCEGEIVPVGMSEEEIKNKTEQAKVSNDTYSLLNESVKNINEHPVDEEFTNEMLEQQDKISSSATWNESESSFSYSDGNQIVTTKVFTKNPKEIKYCEIEYMESSPDVFSDGTTRANSTSSAEVKKTKIIECVETENGWTCPTKEGESIKHDCGKIDNFGEVAGAFEALNEATKDFSCTMK